MTVANGVTRRWQMERGRWRWWECALLFEARLMSGSWDLVLLDEHRGVTIRECGSFSTLEAAERESFYVATRVA